MAALPTFPGDGGPILSLIGGDRKSTRLNSSHGSMSYAVFCLKKIMDWLKRQGSGYQTRINKLLREAIEGKLRAYNRFFFLIIRQQPKFTLFPYTTLFR